MTNSLVVSLAGSSQVAPTYWLNPDNGVSYPIVMQTPQYQIDTLGALKNVPITATGAPPQTLGAIADINRVARSAVVFAVQHPAGDPDLRHDAGRDLGAVAADVQQIIRRPAPSVPEGRAGRSAWAGRDDEQRLLRPAVRAC